jgi:hypothetical protein
LNNWAIALQPTGNAQGGFYFLRLSTGRRIARSRWTELPTPQDVIACIHALAQQQHNPVGLEVLNRHREEIDLDNANDAAQNGNDVHIAGVDDDDDDNNDDDDDDDNDNNNDNKAYHSANEDYYANNRNNNYNDNGINNQNKIQLIRPDWYNNDHEHRDPHMLQDQNLVAWWRRGGNPAELDGLHNQKAPAQAYIHGEPNVLAGMDFDHEIQEQGEGDNQVADNNNVEEEMEAQYGPRTQAYD